MEINKQCNCNKEDKIVLACSGASDLGQITDLTSRKLRDAEVCKMSCLALAAAGLKESIDSFNESSLLVIDGCSIDCGKKIMKKAGIEKYQHLRLTNLGFEKGQTPINDINIEKVFKAAKKHFSDN